MRVRSWVFALWASFFCNAAAFAESSVEAHPEGGDLVWLGATNDINRDAESYPGGSPIPLWLSADTILVEIRRTNSDVGVSLRYGRREVEIPFGVDNRAFFRMTTRRGTEFSIRATRGGSSCFERGYTVTQPGRWGVNVPC